MEFNLKNDKILKKAIAKAKKNGFELLSGDYEVIFTIGAYYNVLFSHDFAEAIWGKEEVEIPNPEWCDNMPVCDSDLEHDYMYAWAYHLQQMVLAKDPLKYLEPFLK